MGIIKNELGKRYGDWLVISYTDARERSNKCVIWECECVHCGAKHYFNGNNLRFDRYRKSCHCQDKRR